MTDAAAQTIDREGKYRLGPRLGAGGMAEVFLGWTVGASGFSRAIVIKRVLPEFSQNEQFAAMFVNEAHLASLLHHPNIVAMHLLDRDPDGNLFQILEYVDGRDLEKLCAVGPLPIPVTIYVIASVLRGLGLPFDYVRDPHKAPKQIREAQTFALSSLSPVALLLTRELMED